VDERAGIVGIGSGDVLVLFEGSIKLAVVEKRLAEGIHGGHVPRFQIGGALVGRDRVFGTLHLVVGGAQGELHARGAVALGNRLDQLGGAIDIAALDVDAGQVENHFFGFGLNVLGDLVLRFGLGLLMLDGVEGAENHVILDALGQQGDDLFEFGNGQVEGVARGRG